MIFHNKVQPKKTIKEVYEELYTPIKSCCECEIYANILETMDFNYRTELKYTKICDFHRETALGKYTDMVRSKLE